MSSCDICGVVCEHPLELVEHRSSLSHQIKLGTLPEGKTRSCWVCRNFSCVDLAEYSKHVDSDRHIAKLRKLRSKRIAMVDSCIPFKKNARYESLNSPAYAGPSTNPPIHPPISSSTNGPFPHPPHPLPLPPNHFSSFFNPSIHTERHPQRTNNSPNQQFPQQQYGRHLHPGPSNRRSLYKKDNRKSFGNGKKGSPVENKNEEIKKKKGGVISKVLSSAAIVKKKKTEKDIVATPKVTSMDNKSKRYESLALKGIVATNQSRTKVMLMERQVKYSLVDRQGESIEESRGTGSFSSMAAICASPSQSNPPPPHFPYQPSHHPSSSTLNASFAPSTSSDNTYAFCHPMHSTPHQLNNSNWPQFVHGIEALDEDTSSSSMQPPQHPESTSFLNGGLGMRRIKEEVREEESTPVQIMSNLNIKQEPPSDQTLSMDAFNQKISEGEMKLKNECEEQMRKLSVLAMRRVEAKRRFDDEMRQIDEEERIEREKLVKLESNRASLHKDLQKVLQAHGF